MSFLTYYTDEYIVAYSPYITKQELDEILTTQTFPQNDKSFALASPKNAIGQIVASFNSSGYSKLGSAEFCNDNFILLTAAHCVYDVTCAKFADSVVFKRELADDGCEQTTDIICMIVPRKYCEYGNEYSCDASRDYALCITSAASNIGCCKYENFENLLKEGENQINAISIGYAKDSPKDPNPSTQCDTLVICKGEAKFYEDKNDKLSMNINIGQGSSGGCWYTSDNSATVFSLNSSSPPYNEEIELGPVLGVHFDEMMQKTLCLRERYKNIRYIELKNNGAYVAEIFVKWKNKPADNYSTAKFTDDITVLRSNKVDLKEISGIKNGAFVRLFVNVKCPNPDNDVEYNEDFIFNSSTERTAYFECAGSIWNADVEKIKIK